MPFSIQKLHFLVNYIRIKEYLMKVGIIGAGASGLALASMLEQFNIDYMLFKVIINNDVAIQNNQKFSGKTFSLKLTSKVIAPVEATNIQFSIFLLFSV